MSSTIRTVIVFVLVVGGIAGVYFLFRDRVSESAGDLRVGDCFEVPTGDSIRDVQHHPCSEPHDGEVFAVGDVEGFGTYPTLAQFDDWVTAECITKGFPAYTGTTYDTRQDVDIGYFYPVEENWGKGDRGMVCYLSPVGGGTITSSYRVGQPASPAVSSVPSG